MASWRDILHIGGGNGFLPDDLSSIRVLWFCFFVFFFSSFLPHSIYPLQIVVLRHVWIL